MPAPRLPVVVAAGLGLLLAAGCEQAEPAGAPATASRAQRAGAPQPGLRDRQGPLRLAPPTAWTRLNPDGPPLFTPRPSPDGRWLAAAGRGGVGLFVVELARPGRVHRVEADRRGPWGWTAPASLRFGGDHGPPRAWRPGGAVTVTRDFVEPWAQPWDDERGAEIWQGAAGSWHHHPKLGTVTFTPAGGAPKVVVDRGAWGARVAPAGRWVAWSTGSLAASRFFVHDRARGETRELGPGLHPVWLAHRATVIYAVPAGVSRRQGRGNVTGAELWLYDGPTGGQRALTDTPERAEMEPALTPAGDAVIFADWQGGSLWRAPLRGGGRP